MGTLGKKPGNRSADGFCSRNAVFLAVGVQRPDLFIGQVDYRPHGRYRSMITRLGQCAVEAAVPGRAGTCNHNFEDNDE
jgi:hypothetical protein